MGAGRRRQSIGPAIVVVAINLGFDLVLGSGVAFAQNATLVGPTEIVGEDTGLATPWVAAGAVGPIVVDPTDQNTIYIGAVNGGVWKSTDGGRNWSVLTPGQSSPSIGALALDRAAPNTIVAGFGNFSSSREIGGAFAGLIRSSDGGRTWSAIGGNALAGQNIDGVTVSGRDILAASLNGGLFRSDDGGASFRSVLSGRITSLVADPSDPSRIYAAVAAGAESKVYRLTNGGAKWTAVFDSSTPGASNALNAATKRLVLAAGPNGSVAVAVLNSVPRSTAPVFQGKGIAPTGIFLSQSEGASWTTLTLPGATLIKNGQKISFGVNPGGQGDTHFSLAIDPSNPRVVYVGGDSQALPSELAGQDPDAGENQGPAQNQSSNSIGARAYTASVYRIDVGPDGSSTPTALTNNYAANNGAPHADTRTIAFSEGRLLLASDGGLYSLTNPGRSGGAWSGLNKGLSLLEVYGAVRDPVSGDILAAAQDNGVLVQSTPTSGQFRDVEGGDGFNVAVNAKSLAAQGLSLDYLGSNFLSVTESAVNSKGQVVDAASVNFIDDGTQINGNEDGVPLGALMKLNNVDPARIAVGGYNVYVGTDPLAKKQGEINEGGKDNKSQQNNIAVTPLLPSDFRNEVSAIDYGTSDNPGALLVGFEGPSGVYLSTTTAPAPGTLKPVAGWPNSNPAPSAVLFDPSSERNFYVVNRTAAVYGTSNSGASFDDLRGDLPNSFRSVSLGYIAADGVKALLVGGVSDQANPESNVFAAGPSDLEKWQPFGLGLPNVIVNSLSYDPVGNELVIGTLGRGVWVVPDATTWFPYATVLRFGAANNDSTPVAEQLTDGVAIGGTNFSRGLLKMGSGTLVLNGKFATYTGSTTVEGGTVAVSGSDPLGRSSGLVLNGGTLSTSGSSTVLGVPITVGTNNGALVEASPGSLMLRGSLSGPGALTLVSNPMGSTIDDDPPTAARLGRTILALGNFVVGDAGHPGAVLESPLVVVGGTLSGDGTISGSLTNGAGVVSPGAPLGTLTVTGDYQQSPDGVLEAHISPVNGSSRLSVGGKAQLAGMLVLIASPGSYQLGTAYDVLDAAGGASGTFGDVIDAGLSPYIDPAVLYTARRVTVSLDPSSLLFATGEGIIANSFVLNQSLLGTLGTVTGSADEVGRFGPGSIAKPTHGTWVHALGGFGAVDGYSVNQYGGVIGHGAEVTPGFVAGVAASGIGTMTSGDDDSVTGQSAGLYAYGIRTIGRLRLSGALGAGGYSLQTRRGLPLADRAAHGSTAGWFAGAALSAEYRIALKDGAFVTPFADARYLHTNTGGFTDSGAGPFTIGFGPVATNAMRAGGGVRVGWTTMLRGVALTPWAMLGGSATIGQQNASGVENIAGFMNTETVRALPGATLDTGAGLELQGNGRWRLTMGWHGQYAQASHYNLFELKLRYRL